MDQNQTPSHQTPSRNRPSGKPGARPKARRRPAWKDWPKSDVRLKLRNWAFFPLVLGLWESVAVFGIWGGFAVFLLVCAALRPLLKLLLLFIPPARKDCAWMGALLVCAFAVDAWGASAAVTLHFALFFLWLALGADWRSARA